MSYNQPIWSPFWNPQAFHPHVQSNTYNQQLLQARQPTQPPVIFPPSPASHYAFPSGQALPFYQQAPDGTTFAYGVPQPPGCAQPAPGYPQGQPGLFGAPQFPPGSAWGSQAIINQLLFGQENLQTQLSLLSQRMDGKIIPEAPFQNPFPLQSSIPQHLPNMYQSTGMHFGPAAAPLPMPPSTAYQTQSIPQSFLNRPFPNTSLPVNPVPDSNNLPTSTVYKPPEPLRLQSVSPFAGPRESSIASPFVPAPVVPPSLPAEPAGVSAISAAPSTATNASNALLPVMETGTVVSSSAPSTVSPLLSSAQQQESTSTSAPGVTAVTNGQENMFATYSDAAVSVPPMPAAVVHAPDAPSASLLQNVPALPTEQVTSQNSQDFLQRAGCEPSFPAVSGSSLAFSVGEINGQWVVWAPLAAYEKAKASHFKKTEMERDEDNNRRQLEAVPVVPDKWDAASTTSENTFVTPLASDSYESVEERVVPDVVMQEGQNGLLSTSSVSSSPCPQAMPLAPVQHSMAVEEDTTFSPDPAASSTTSTLKDTQHPTTGSTDELPVPGMQEFVAPCVSGKRSDAVSTAVDQASGVPVKKQKVDEASAARTICTTPMRVANKRGRPRKEPMKKNAMEASIPVPEDDEENLPAGMRRSPSVDSLRSVEIPPGCMRLQQSVNVIPSQAIVVEDAMESCPESMPEQLECFSAEVLVATALPTAEVLTKSSAKRKMKSSKENKSALVDHMNVQKKDCAAWRDEIHSERDRYGLPKTSTDDVPLCFDCDASARMKAARRRSKDQECRFNGARLRCVKFTSKKLEDNYKTPATAKLDLVKESEERPTVEEEKLWYSQYLRSFFTGRRQRGLPKEPATSPKEAVYILRRIGPVVLDLLSQHENHLSDHKGSVALKHIPPGMTESCDVCATSIFNAHYVCLQCGYCVCPDCYQRRIGLLVKEPKTAEEEDCLKVDVEAFCPESVPRDKLDWHACPTNPANPIPEEKCRTGVEKEFPHTLMPTRIIPSDAVRMIQNGINQLLAMQIPSLELCPNSPPDMEQQDFLCDGNVLWFPSPQDIDVEAFRAHWSKGLPVLISGVGNQLTDEASPLHSIWHPDWFAKQFGNEKVKLINCAVRPQEGITGRKHSDFWKGFANVKQRDRDEEGAPRLLKIKDWPTDSRFSDLLPHHYKALCEVFPLPEYTYEKGSMNLTSYMHKNLNPPDLGPKMYIAYGMAEKPENPTTNLHLDISDAVNILVHVSKPSGSGDVEADHDYIRTAKLFMWNLAIDEQTKTRLREGHLPGAVWHIYRPEDTATIRQFLSEQRTANGGTGADPLHTQMEFLTETVRKKLLQDTGVEGFTVVQFDGDAIFIPAGALHQVWNVHSCIKVAEDFVSPEHVSQCLHLTEEFRHLPLSFHNKHDKLQVKTTLFQTAKNLLPIALQACTSLDMSGNVPESLQWN